MIARECVSLLGINAIVTDTSITVSTPLTTPAPISLHIASITYELYQGLTLLTSQVITTVNTTNTVNFTGLNQNTTYTVKTIIQYTNADTYPKASYDNGGTANTNVCLYNIITNTTPACAAPIILSITES
jgi:hypothetical protein